MTGAHGSTGAHQTSRQIRHYNGGTLPLGYTIDSEQRFQIDPLTAPFVLEAYKRYADGSTMKKGLSQ